MSQHPPETLSYHVTTSGDPICVSLSPVEGLKVVEIEKCKSDIKKMREELAARNSR